MSKEDKENTARMEAQDITAHIDLLAYTCSVCGFTYAVPFISSDSFHECPMCINLELKEEKMRLFIAQGELNGACIRVEELKKTVERLKRRKK